MTDTNSMHIAICDAYDATNHSLRTQGPSGGEGRIGIVAGSTKSVITSFTRPADTTAYAVNDAVADSTTAPTILTFANMARANAGSGYITKAKLTINSAVTTNASFRLWLYNASVTPTNDNAAFTLLNANADARIGYIDFALTTEGTGSDCCECTVSNISLPFVTGAASTALYGLLEAKAAYTPTNAGVFKIQLVAEQN